MINVNFIYLYDNKKGEEMKRLENNKNSIERKKYDSIAEFTRYNLAFNIEGTKFSKKMSIASKSFTRDT
jgi:hypothetical protein